MSVPDLQPVLEGPRLTLRPLRPEDWDEMFAAGADPEIWAVHPERHRYEEPLFRQFFDGGLECGGALTILDKSTGRMIGSSRYIRHDPQRREIEIGWTFLTRAYWGGDYNRELKRLMLDHAFTFADTVVFWVGEDNLRSRRAMEKIGGVPREVQMRNYSWGPCPHLVYEIRKGQRFGEI